MNHELHEKHDRFLSLLEPVRSRLARFCRAISSDNESARDLASQTILVAYEHFEQIREPERFRSYCFQVASRLQKRDRWRNRNRVAYDPVAAESITDPGPSPDASLAAQELYSALATLPKTMRDAVILFEITGLSLEEIRQIQGGSLSGVKSRIARGRERLARMLRVSNEATGEPLRMVGSTRSEGTSYSFARSELGTVKPNAKATIL
jgi:RNA polymerase sigma-70 factor, ECF subfamily